MDYKIDDFHQEYIKITVTGVMEKKKLFPVMSELINHPDYNKKHSLWDLTRASSVIDISDIKEIVGFLSLYRLKEKPFANKSAFLVSNQRNKAFVNIYIMMSKVLPFQYSVFTEQNEAENFLTGAD